MRLSRRGWWCLSVSAVCWLGSFVLILPLLAAVPAVGISALVVAAILLVFRDPVHEISRSLQPDELEVGGDLTVRVAVPGADESTRWHDELPEAFTGDASGTGDSGRYRVRALARGAHRLGPLTTVDSDPFGLFRRRRHHRLVTPVLVLPRRLDAVAVAAADIGRSAESLRPSRRSGQGDDDVVARPYVVGDEVKRVHWKATARRGELMVRQEEDREHARLVVVLDHEATVHQTTQDEFGRWTVSPSLEWCVSAAATIVHEWSDRGVDIDIVGLGGFECFAHEGRVRHVLAEVEPVRDQGRTTLPAVVRTHVVVLTGSLEEHDAMALRTAIVGDWVTVFHGPSSPEAVARLEQFGWALVLREDS